MLSVNKASKKAAHQVAFSILNFDRIDELHNASTLPKLELN